MAVKKIITYPDPVLRQETRPVTAFDDELKELVQDLADTMYAAPGAGLAANQIGVSCKVVIIDTSPGKEEREHLVLVNPEIIDGEGSMVEEEGCLSVIDFSAKVKRLKKIKIKAQDMDGNMHEFEAEDHLARVVQHELDHLNCILFIDRVSLLQRSLYKKKLKKMLRSKET